MAGSKEEIVVGVALCGHPSVEGDAGVATEGHPSVEGDAGVATEGHPYCFSVTR